MTVDPKAPRSAIPTATAVFTPAYPAPSPSTVISTPAVASAGGYPANMSVVPVYGAAIVPEDLPAPPPAPAGTYGGPAAAPPATAPVTPAVMPAEVAAQVRNLLLTIREDKSELRIVMDNAVQLRASIEANEKRLWAVIKNMTVSGSGLGVEFLDALIGAED